MAEETLASTALPAPTPTSTTSPTSPSGWLELTLYFATLVSPTAASVLLEGYLLDWIQPFHNIHLLPLQFQLLQLLQPPHELLHPDAFDWHRFWSFTTLLIPVRDPLPLPLSPLVLFPPATLTSFRETGSLLARAPLDCRAAAVCEQVAIASKGRAHQVLRLVAWQCEDFYHSPWRVLPRYHHELVWTF